MGFTQYSLFHKQKLQQKKLVDIMGAVVCVTVYLGGIC